MRIAVNTRLLLKGKLEGIGWFTYENFERITKQHPEHQFFFLFDRPYSDDFIFASNVTPIILKPQSRHPILWYIWFEWAVEKFLKKHKIDIFVSPDGYLSLKTDIPQLAVIHDINFYHNPKGLPLITSWYFNKYFPKFAYKAKRIVTVSEYSKTDISQKYKVPLSKIDVVYNGCNENFVPIGKIQQENTRWEYCFNEQYFVFVGSLHPRKNLINLFKAFDIFKTNTKKDIKLLIVGQKRWWTEEINSVYENLTHKEDIVFTGRVDEDKLHRIIGSSLAMTYVSYFEGFGIPILEAFNCDTALITSNVTSMPEIAGDAALFVDPFSPESIADAMTQIATNELLRQELILKGRIQRQKFSWQKSANLVWECIQKTIKED